METGVLIALGFFLIQKANRWIGLFTLLMVFSSFYPVVGKNSYFTRNCIFYGLFWYMIVILVFNKNTVKYLMWGMCGIAFVHILFLVWQNWGYDPYKTFSFGLMKTEICVLPTGIMANPNEASSLLAFVAPAFLIFRRYSILGLILIALGMWIANSLGGIVALTIGMMFFLSIHYRSWELFVGLMVVAVCASFLYFKFCDLRSATSRWDIWANGWKYYKVHWILGYGLGHWKLLTKQLHAHNDIFQAAFEMGIGFLVILIGYLVNIARRFKCSNAEHILPTMALIIIISNAAVSFPFYVATTAIVAVTWMAILEINLREVESC